uniref:NR LBD domain-containing protein n=1 Tax=Acrobeloides nanus TaxID=290746 RepID=A0A914CAP6_9BILA
MPIRPPGNFSALMPTANMPSIFGDAFPANFLMNLPKFQKAVSPEATIMRVLHWSRSMLSFVPNLSSDEQLSTVTNSLSRLVLLTAVEEHILTTSSLNSETVQLSEMSLQIRDKLKALVTQIETMRLDPNEFNMLRIILLLKEKAAQMQQFMLWNLAQHQQLFHSYNPLRYIQTMVLVDCLCQLEPNALLGIFSSVHHANGGIARMLSETANAMPLLNNNANEAPNRATSSSPVDEEAMVNDDDSGTSGV